MFGAPLLPESAIIGGSLSGATNADSILHGAANGYLTPDEPIQAYSDLMKGTNVPTGSTEIVMIYSAPGVIAGTAVVAIEAGVATVVGGAVIGLTSNGTYQLISKPVHELDFGELAIATGVGALSGGKGFVGTVTWGTLGGAASSAIKGDDPVAGAVGGIGGATGGKIISNITGPVVGGIISEAISDNLTDVIKEIRTDKESK